MRPLRASVALAALAMASPAWTQSTAPALAAGGGGPQAVVPDVVTDIVADSDPGRSLGTTVTSSAGISTIDGGTVAGANLFHSFARFDLAQGDTARWVHGAGDPAGIANIVNRVTGGDPSTIRGTLDASALPNADFWFVNPAGILFGEGARLDVAGAAHFSTGEELRFADGVVFAVTTPGGSTLSVASPEAFGFLGGQGALALDGLAEDFATADNRLTFAASDITVTDSRLAASGFGLFAVGAGAAEIMPGQPATTLGGDLSVESAGLRLARSAAGATGIVLAGGRVSLVFADIGSPFFDDGLSAGAPVSIAGANVELFASFVSSSTFGAEDAGDIAISGGDVLIGGNSLVITDAALGSTGLTGDILLTGNTVEVEDSRVTASTRTDRPSGSVSIVADTAVVGDGAVVAAVALPGAGGDAGSIFIEARTLGVGPAAAITSATSGSGSAGAVTIDVAERMVVERAIIGSEAEPGSTGNAGLVMIGAGELLLLDQSAISTTTSGSAAAGLIQVQAGSILLDGESQIESASNGDATGSAGLIMLFADSVTLRGGSQVRSDTFGQGGGGGVLIQAADVELSGGAMASSSSLGICFDDACRTGDAGGVAVIADRLALIGDPDEFALAQITSDTRGTGNAGAVSLNVGELVMAGPSLISSDTFGSGQGGTIDILAASVAISDDALISTGTFGSGQGGTIDIETGALRLADGGRIVAQSRGPDGGRGGAIVLRADDVLLFNEAEINSSTFGTGDAGSIDIAAGRLQVDRNSLISSDSLDAGNGGSILLRADELLVTDGSIIAAEAINGCFGPDCPSPGDAGEIVIEVGRLEVRGSVDEFGDVRSGITSSSLSAARAGNITVNANAVFLDRGEIASEAHDQGDAGNVKIVTGSLSLVQDSVVTTSSNPFCLDCAPGGGDAGTVVVMASGPVVLRSGSALSSSTSGLGDAGEVDIQADLLDIEEASVASTTSGPGDAGAIVVNVDRLRLGFLGAIESLTRFGSSGNGGSIDVKAGEVRLTDGARLSSASGGTGAAGRIGVAADTILIDVLSGITSSAGAFASVAGLVTLDAVDIRIDNNSFVTSSTAGTGAGGDVVIEADRLFVGNISRISSSTSGDGAGGAVIIEAGEVELEMVAEIAAVSEEFSNGAGGLVAVTADRLAISSGAALTTEAFGGGSAGLVSVEAGTLDVTDGGTITSSGRGEASSGAVTIAAGSLTVADRGTIATNSDNANPAGDIAIAVDSLVVDGLGASISSANRSAAGGAAGTVEIATAALTLSAGGAITTSSAAGAAGDITITMPQHALLRLESDGAPSMITTSSGPGTGGRITIAEPFAIISDGGSILALGEQGGANVRIDTGFFISSADRPNRVAVDGAFLLEAQVGDVSSGTVERDLSVIDASGVLRGQCAAVRETGQVSQLVVRPVGPYGTSGGEPTVQPGSCR